MSVVRLHTNTDSAAQMEPAHRILNQQGRPRMRQLQKEVLTNEKEGEAPFLFKLYLKQRQNLFRYLVRKRVWR